MVKQNLDVELGQPHSEQLDVWNLDKSTREQSITLPDTDLLTASGDTSTFAFWKQDSCVEIWDRNLAQSKRKLELSAKDGMGIALSADGSKLAREQSGGVAIYDLTTGSLSELSSGDRLSHKPVQFSQDGKYLLTQSGITFHYWHLTKGNRVTVPFESAYETALSSSGDMLAVCERQNSAVWNATNGQVTPLRVLSTFAPSPIMFIGLLLAIGFMWLIVRIFGAPNVSGPPPLAFTPEIITAEAVEERTPRR
jgi:hypothetical protein